MKARTIHRLRILSGVAFSILLAVTTVFGAFESPVKWIQEQLMTIGIANPDWARATLVCIVALVVFLCVVTFQAINRRLRTSIVTTVTANPVVKISADVSGERIDDFRTLRAEAKASMYVMGIGATSFSSDTSLLNKLLQRGLKIRILTMSPFVIKGPLDGQARPSNDMQMEVFANAFDDLFARPQYHAEVMSSYMRLSGIPNANWGEDGDEKLQIHAHRYCLPINLTAIDEGPNGKVLLEYCLPFSDQRLRMLFSATAHPEAYAVVMQFAENLWARSEKFGVAHLNSSTSGSNGLP